MTSLRPTTANSAISSAMSEDGDKSRPRSEVSLPSQSFTPSHTRRGPQSSNFSISNPSRPQSSASRVSRSHIPSLTHAFFRPMTSQQAQRQRGARPNTGRTIPSTFGDEAPNDAMTESRRSISTLPPPGQYGQRDETEALPPPSRGSEFTDQMAQDQATTPASPGGNTTVRSGGETTHLIRGREGGQKARPPSLTLGGDLRDRVPLEKTQKSPIGSFRSNFSLATKGHSFAEPGHQHLSSTASSPRFDMRKDPERALPRTDLGRNYEYFEGNTVFFWGGRLQNARDRPVNIATGLFVLIPGVLFFVFS